MLGILSKYNSGIEVIKWPVSILHCVLVIFANFFKVMTRSVNVLVDTNVFVALMPGLSRIQPDIMK